MTNKRIFIIIFLFLSLLSAPVILSAQDTNNENARPSKSIADRFFFGGNLGLQFGTTTYIDLSPIVGYRITEKLHVGTGITYIYLNSKLRFGNLVYKYETSMYGGRLFGRYYILENLFGHAEYEYLNIGFPFETASAPGNIKIQRQDVHSMFVGGGYAQSIGPRSSLVLMLLWNLNEDIYSPYQNPVIRIGFNAGF